MIRIGKVRNLEKVTAHLSKVKHGVKGVSVEGVAEFLVGNERRGLQYYPPVKSWYKHKRTYATRFGWKIKNWGDGTRIRIVNDVKHAIYPYTRWAGQPWGWRTISERIASNMTGAIRHAQSLVNKLIRKG